MWVLSALVVTGRTRGDGAMKRANVAVLLIDGSKGINAAPGSSRWGQGIGAGLWMHNK